MTAFLTFRGPDGSGVWRKGAVGLCHTRAGHAPKPTGRQQPSTVDGEVWVTGDLRIDGREELLKKLGLSGTETVFEDADLLLHAYRAWDEDCLQHIVGDFSFALWDERRGRLFCAVDPFRVKQFFYARQQNALVFSNTLECVLRAPQVDDRLDEQALGDFLLFGFFQEPDLTIYADVKRLSPGCYLLSENGNQRTVRYWSVPPSAEASTPAPADCLERFQELFARAVRDRIRGPGVGILLSGGIDSALVAATARGLKPGVEGKECVRGYTVVFDRLIPDREQYYAGLVAQALDLPIEFHPADDFEPGMDTTGLVPRPPEPLTALSWSWIVQFRRHIASDCSCVLTGDDGDTMLMANLALHWRELLRARHLGRLVRDATSYILSQRSLPPVGFRTLLRRSWGSTPRATFPNWLHPEFVRRASLRERWQHYQTALKPQTARGLARDHLTSPIWAGIFDNYDPGWTGMPLEFRHPFMDVRLVTFLLGLPAFPWCVNKELFRRALRGKVPDEIVRRPKTCLPGDPERSRLLERPEWWLRHATLAPAMETYINLKAWRDLVRNGLPDPLHGHLRPVYLSEWLGAERGAGWPRPL
jgi:asparagine synthase (glutamine-hydrolysing)